METNNTQVKFGQEIRNRLGKMPEKFRGDFFDSHCSHARHALI